MTMACYDVVFKVRQQAVNLAWYDDRFKGKPKAIPCLVMMLGSRQATGYDLGSV